MRQLSVLLVLACALLVAACDTDVRTGSGRLESRSFDLSGFTELEAGGGFEVEVTAGSGYEVVVEADDNLFDVLVVELRGSRLVLRVDPGTSVRNGEIRARVVAPDLSLIRVSGASRVEAFEFSSRVAREIRVSGASSFEGSLNATELSLEVSGASRVILSGAADRLDLEASGASDVAATEFDAAVARVRLSGASSARVTVLERIERASLSGASSLVYGGGAVVEDVSTSGASSIRRR